MSENPKHRIMLHRKYKNPYTNYVRKGYLGDFNTYFCLNGF